jgi:hypothetical protein
LIIVLPDMTGTQVAALIKAGYPNIADHLRNRSEYVGELKAVEEKHLLRKPFTAQDYSTKSPSQ